MSLAEFMGSVFWRQIYLARTSPSAIPSAHPHNNNMIQLPPVAIAVIVVLVLIIAYVAYTRMSGPPKGLTMSGFGYAKCDGKYVWTGKVDAKGNLIFTPAADHPDGQATARALALHPDGQGVACGESVSKPSDFGTRSPTENADKWANMKLTYDAKLLEAAKKITPPSPTA